MPFLNDMRSGTSPTISATSSPYTPLNEGKAHSLTAATSPPSSPSLSELDTESDDIAIIGYGCRVAGENNTPSQLWSYLLDKGDGSGEIPQWRWDSYRKRQRGNAEILSGTTSKGYFVDRIEDFDAGFFGISPREAEQMDPQQRITAEVVWEALEHSGIPPQSLSGSDTAVFMGVNSDDYSRLLLEDLPNVEAWMGIGTAFCGIPNRVSHMLNLLGPSSAIDAACASSLVAIHHGRQALLARETSLVIAGGVNALIGPGLTRVLDAAGAISTDGRCRSFDESAAGYGRGEGAGIVIMKRLADAEQDGDSVLAVLKGSAVGADGRTNGIMAPNQYAQERVAKEALKAAKVSARTISYVEAHATSTALGDPTECAALAAVYGSGARQPDSEPCYIGSLKSNIGHLEAGAGVMGLIKTVMILQEGLVPPQANLTKLNTKIDWPTSMLRIATKPTTLPVHGWPRRAAVASYGYGGTVSHAVLEAPLSQSLRTAKRSFRPPRDKSPVILLLSAPSSSRIKVAASDLAHFLAMSEEFRNGEIDLQSVAYTLAVKRGHHRFRTAILADSQTEAVHLLNEVTQARQNPQICMGSSPAKGEDKGSVWVFSGHGAQWKSMGLTLLDEEPAFAEVIRELEPIIQKHLGFSATAALRAGDLESTDKVQVLTFVMQVGLAAVLKSIGIQPRAIVGHSNGEIAAAVVAEALSLREGALIICIRARLFRKVAGTGAMVLVQIPFSEASLEIGESDDVAVAIDSSPTSCVVSGTLEAVEQLSGVWKDKGIQVRTVQTDTAFHSPMLLPLVAPLQDGLRGILNPQPPRVPLYSTSAQDPRTTRLRDADYWTANMVKPVLLNSTVTAAAQDGFRVFLEVSSHPIVSHSILEILSDAEIADASVIPTLLRNKDTQKSLFSAVGKLHCVGDSADFKSFIPGKWLPNIPGTRWEHKPYWREVTDPSSARNVSHDAQAHVLLGGQTSISGTNIVLWQTTLDPSTKPFPGNHPLHGSEIVPAAVLLNTFLSAAPGRSLQNVSLKVPVVVGPPREVQVILDDNNIRICSRLTDLDANSKQKADSWVVNTTAHVSSFVTELTSPTAYDISAIKGRLLYQLKNSFTEDYLANVGVTEMGFPWKVLEHFGNEHEMLARVHADPNSSPSKHFHGKSWASILDAATSISSTIFFKKPLLRMPTVVKRVSIFSDELTPKFCYIHAATTAADTANVTVLSEEGQVLCMFESLKFAGIEGNASMRKSVKGLVHRVAWPPAQLSEVPLSFRNVVIVSEESSALLEGYQSQLQAHGFCNMTISNPENLLEVSNESAIIYLPETAQATNQVYQASANSCRRLLDIMKILLEASCTAKVFCITQNVFKSNSPAALSQAALHGLARIIKSEEPEIFGGLIDVEDDRLPIQTIKYVQGFDVIRIEDTVARNARLRPFPDPEKSTATQKPFRVLASGTYVITGGLGALGFEIASYLAEKGARRLVLVSRRKYPPRHQWDSLRDNEDIRRILVLEALGVSVFPVSVDLTSLDAVNSLLSALGQLSLPPVLGVIHAAGILANQLVRQTTPEAFDSVIAPKINGAMALHEAFPPKSLEFLVLFSSCGQLLGFPGQASYASGNAFLDSLATHRRSHGDNTISMMWTSWRGLGMASSTRFIDAELHARGITDITRDDAFLAWEHIFNYNTDHAAILRALPIGEDEPSPHPILNDILIRNRVAKTGKVNPGDLAVQGAEPTGGPELGEFLTRKITQCVASTLSLSEDAVDPNLPLSELGMDSVMTVEFRVQLQSALKRQVGPTLLWKCPTVGRLVRHYLKENVE